ncbi:hypothetical protein D3C85_1631340 [compost metagenome]
MVRSSSLLRALLMTPSALIPTMRINKRVTIFNSQTSGIIRISSGPSRKLLG